MAMSGTPTYRPSPAQQAQSLDAGPLPLDEIIARHRGEWVLMRVTNHDEDYWPSEGYVVAHAPTDEELLTLEEQAPRATPGQPYYSFYAAPFITSGPIYESAVKRFIGELVVAAHRASRDRAGL
jgi:hypothetical protein